MGPDLSHFVTGGIAGSVGAAAVYPVDLVKTRLQNERTKAGGNPRYANAWECAKGVVLEEGIGALYQGLVPQIVGVWPEKAVKLGANDFVRSLFMDQATGFVPLVWQIAAGGCGGMCQIVFTNPLEIVKVRLQVGSVVLEWHLDDMNECNDACDGVSLGFMLCPM